MRFTEHELTVAVTAAAKTVAAGGRRRRKTDPDDVWDSMGRYQRYQVMDAVGSQLLPVLVDLPDVDVAAGTRPTFTDEQVATAVERNLGEGGGRVRRKVTAAARVLLVKQALAALPVRQDPDGLLRGD